MFSQTTNLAKDDQFYLGHGDYSFNNQMAPMTNEHSHPKMTPTSSVNQSVYPDGRKRATKACNACKQRHTRCGFERPCTRCVSLGYDCQDPPSKKRGSKKSDGIEKQTKTKGFKAFPMDKMGSFRQEAPHIMTPFEFQMQLQQMAQQSYGHHMVFMPQSFEQTQMQFTQQEDGAINLYLSTDAISEVSNH